MPGYSSFSKDGRQWPEVGSSWADSQLPDHEWGAAATASLTEHGSAVLQLLGDFYRRETWTSLLGGSPTAIAACDEVTVFNAQTNGAAAEHASASAFMAGMLPQCSMDAINVWNGADVQAIFNQGGDETPAQCDGMPTKETIDAGIIGGNIDKLVASYSEDITSLQDAIGCCAPEICAAADGITVSPDWTIGTPWWVNRTSCVGAMLAHMSAAQTLDERGHSSTCMSWCEASASSAPSAGCCSISTEGACQLHAGVGTVYSPTDTSYLFDQKLVRACKLATSSPAVC